jgi:hypothetical protein
MKRLLWLVLIAAPLFAQPVTTTVADQLFMAVGGPTYCSGTITISWPDFYSEDAYMIKAGTLSTAVNSTGNFSVALVPTNTNLTPAAGIYGIRYNLQPAGCAATSEAWNVPSSGSPVDLNMVRALPSPPPSLIPVTSLAPPLSNANSALCFSGGYVLWSSICTSSGSPITGSGTAGKLAKFTAAMVIGNAGYADVVANWTGCSGTEYLGFDGNCHTPISQLTATAIIGLWSGCSGTDYLGADGGCHTSGGMIYPGAGVPCSTGSAWCTSYSATTLTAFLNPFSSSLQGLAPASGGGTANYLRADGTWTTPPSGIGYPGAGVACSTGSAWCTSYTATTLTAFLNPFSSSLQGLAPSSGGGTTNFLRADGTWAVPSGSFTYPGVGVACSTGSAWCTSYTATTLTAFLNPFSTSLQGLAPASGGGTANYLRADGTWDAPPGSGNATSINGNGVPASQPLIASNGSSQLVGASGHSVAEVLDCIAASGSATAYTCNTSPSYSLASGDKVWFKADVANTGSATLAINSGTAATIKKQQGSANLVANDLLVGGWTEMQFDGTNMQMIGQTGNASSGGSGFIQTLTAPVAANFTQVNFNTGSGVTTTQANLSSPVTAISILQRDPSGTSNFALLAKSKLAATFTVTMAVSYIGDMAGGDVAGLWLNDGGTNSIFFGSAPGSAGPFISSYNTFTPGGSTSADYSSGNQGSMFPVGLNWLRVQETVSARNFYVSSDGQTWAMIYTEGNTNHFTTSLYGFGTYVQNSGHTGQTMITCYSFTETNP